MDPETRSRRICEAIAAVPPGTVASYGQIADIAGVPRGARQVGYVLRRLPEGHRLPWHRIVRLRAEGVRGESGRVDMRRFRWQPDLDELIWAPPVDWQAS